MPELPDVAAANQARIDEMAAAIKAFDPAFTLEGLLDDVSARFVSLKQAWASGEIDSVRPLLGDSLYAQWQEQVGEQRSAGVSNVIDGLQVVRAQVLAATQAGAVDKVLVGLEYQAVHYAVSSGGQLLFGSTRPGQFVEFWTFARTAGPPATTCPSCGAPLAISPEGLCRYCRAVLPPALLGWIALEASDELDWQGF